MSLARPPRWLLPGVPLLGALLLACTPAAAKKIYKYVDADGIVHYTDKPPDTDAEVEAIPVRVDRQQIVRLRLDGTAAERRALAFNAIAGPVEVELGFGESINIVAEPPLPLRRVIPADAEVELARFHIGDAGQRASFRLDMAAVPGDPAARPEDVEYALPVESGAWRIDQGFAGSFSHTGAQSLHAIDINVPEGTPVLAARGGVVMHVEDDFEGAGLDREKFGGRANHVRVLHSDGSMAVYAHLQPETVKVRQGQRVSVGQRLGASGNTGFSTGPHLHFAIQVNRGMELVSIPFRLSDANGPVTIPGAP